MLLHLKIKDFAIIDRAEVTVPQGFTVVTGETGAGKSILVDALVVALGGRAAQDLVRTGAESAEVEALFDISGHPIIRARLEQRDLAGDDPDVLLVRRVIGQKGKGKVLVNGHLATVATLGEIVRGLVDISGQHEQLSLLQDDSHLDILDAFGELEPLREQLRAAFEAYATIQREREQLEKNAHDNVKHADFLRFQLEEIERAGVRAGEDQELAVEQKRLLHAEKLKGGAELAEALVYGDDGSAFDKLGKAAAEVEALVRIDPELGPISESLAAARREIEEAARALSRYGGHIEADNERLNTVEERLSTITRLCKKHGGDLATVLERGEAIRNELDGIINVDARLDELGKKLAAQGQEVGRLGKELSAARKKAAAKLDKSILSEVAEMELPEAVFVTSVTPRVLSSEGTQIDGRAVGITGFDKVEFLWSANRGEPPRALARIASGGELSRLMLAVKTVLSSRDLVSLYVFDEVDTGLGGKAADSIGRKIQRVARGHQALTITHLAPIAARADHHVRVEKEVQGDRTVSRLALIEGTERAQEIARMIDGAKITKTTLDAAKAMLQRAQKEARV
jgi:DNA repair protein RecN (Recombination protein N)